MQYIFFLRLQQGFHSLPNYLVRLSLARNKSSISSSSARSKIYYQVGSSSTLTSSTRNLLSFKFQLLIINIYFYYYCQIQIPCLQFPNMNKSILKKHNDKKDIFDYLIKLIIIGDSGVGKTNILTRFCENIFKDSHVATIGVDFNVKNIQIEDKKLKLQIWDTAGQQRFKTITQTYYKGAYGIVLVYAVDCRESFLSIEKWINQVNQRTSSSVKKILVANKIDLKSEGLREISYDEGKKMAEKYNLKYLEVSAKEDKQIEDIFYILSKEIKDKLVQDAHNDLQQLSRTISINMSYQQKQRTKEEEQKKYRYCNC